jgi:hypothetical protein
MKKLLFVLAGVIFCSLLFVSCDKDDDEKISRIKSIKLDNQFYEEYVYESNGKLKTINHFLSGDGVSVTNYEDIIYADGKVSRVNVYGSGYYFLKFQMIYNALQNHSSKLKVSNYVQVSYIEITWDGSKVSEAKIYSASEGGMVLAGTMTFNYDGGKLSTMISEMTFEELTITSTTAYTWSNDNLSNEVTSYDGTVILTVNYQFDDMMNIYEIFRKDLPMNDYQLISENNVTRIEEISGDETDIRTFSYTYNDKSYPITMVETEGSDVYNYTLEYETEE